MLEKFKRIFLTALIISLIGLGAFDYLQNIDTNECSMTYMFQNPNLIPVKMPAVIEKKFLNYKLYLYCEEDACPRNENLRFTEPGNIPVLFVTGNADSHKQVRSMASVGIDKSRKSKGPKKNIKFHYFTISFNEELSALYGPILMRQTEFTKICIQHILGLFKNVQPLVKRPTSVLVIGNSMGGVVSRGLMVPMNQDDDFYQKKLIHTIITQATPHLRPVLNIDKPMSDFYEKINSFWLNKSETSLDNVVLASLYGGTRDILVRTGLTNINKWKKESPATIISSYTLSMPYVWRSVDHRCMAWCRELVIAVNRALFDLVDIQTEQITESKDERERVLKFYLEHDHMQKKKSDQDNDIIFSEINVKKLEITENQSQMHFQLNGFIHMDKLILFNLAAHLNTSLYDSLFIYTNFNAPRSFLMCKDFRTVATNEYKCTDALDLYEKYGRAIPPLLEGRRDSTLRTLNINNMASLMKESGYTYLIVNVPILKPSPNRHQLVVKFDWYMRDERESLLEMPSFKTNLQNVHVASENVVFRRYYLSNLKDVLQAYQVFKVETPCDVYLQAESSKKKQEQKPLSISAVMLQYHEGNQESELITHSQAIQTKSKILDLKLSTNLNQEQMSYIDVINFDVNHLLHHTSKQSHINVDQCKPQLEFSIAYMSILGQVVRFFLMFTPAFIIVIVQFFDFLSLKTKLQDESFQSYFYLNKVQTLYSSHLMHSLIFNIIIYISQTEIAVQFIALLDPTRSIIPHNDFELLKIEGTFHPLAGFLLYWSAFSIISVASGFLSAILNFLSVFLQRAVLKFFVFFEGAFFQKFLALVHLIVSITMGLYSSTLTHCGLFYGEMIKLAAKNPIYTTKSTHIQFCIDQTRLLLVYLLLVLNIPSVIVWAKSLQSNQLAPFYTIMPDSGVNVAAMSIILHQMRYFKHLFKVTFFDLKSDLLAGLVLINSILTILYSSVNIYRLQYFILVHLFLMTFHSVTEKTPSVSDKHKKNI